MASGISSGQKPTGVTDLDSVQTLENKTLDSSSSVNGAPITGSDIISPTRLDVKKDELSELQDYVSSQGEFAGNPIPSNGQLCFATDAKKMYQVLDGALAEVGSGQGGINYISNPDFELNVDDWTGDANLTIARSEVSPLRGDASGVISKGAVDATGQVVKTIPFTIDAADLAKKLYISADVDASDDNYADGDLRWKIVKDPNGTPVTIRPNGEDILGGNFARLAWFQTDATITEYELQIECNSANASAYSIKIDNVSVGPKQLAYGTSLATQTITATSGQNTLIPTKTPTGLEFDTSLFTDEGSSLISYATASSRTTFTALQDCRVFIMLTGLAASSVNIELYKNGTRLTRSANPAANNTFSSLTSKIDLKKDDTFYLTVDTSTLSSTTAPASINIHASSTLDALMSEDIGNREVAVSGGVSSGVSIPHNVTTKITNLEVDEDTANILDSVNNKLVIPESGYYSLDFFCTITMSNNNGRQAYSSIRVNGTQVKFGTRVDAAGSNILRTVGSLTSIASIKLVKGDEIEFYMYQNNNSGTTHSTGSARDGVQFTLRKLAQPQTLLETETVAARYTSSSGQSITANSDIIYENLVVDTHNAYDTSTGEYTVPISGYYQINARIRTVAFTCSSGERPMFLRLEVNGTIVDWGSPVDNNTSAVTKSYAPSNSSILKLEKGDVLVINQFNSLTGGSSLSTNAEYNTFSIARIK